MQDKEETTPEASRAAVVGRKENEGWRLEPEVETEAPELIVLWNEAEGVPVNPDGEGHREQAQAKSSRRERETPGEQGVEVKKSQKRKAIRVEPEVTQEYLREAMDLIQEDSEEISFVPSAISANPLFLCDNRCSEKTLSFWQFSSVVIKEGEESYTTNLVPTMLQQNSGGKWR